MVILRIRDVDLIGFADILRLQEPHFRVADFHPPGLLRRRFPDMNKEQAGEYGTGRRDPGKRSRPECHRLEHATAVDANQGKSSEWRSKGMEQRA